MTTRTVRMTGFPRPAPRMKIRTGGLFRCCVETAMEHPEPVPDGTKLACKYEKKDRMIARDGAWEWNHDEA